MAISEEFDRSLGWGGSTVIECRCGRTNFAGQKHLGCDSEEHEHLLSMAEKQPDKFVQHEGSDSVSSTHIGGYVFVYGCPCGQLEELERFLLSARHNIIDFYKAYSASKIREAKELARMLDGVSDA